MQHSWLNFEAPKGAPSLETSDVDTSQKPGQCVLTTRWPCRIQNQWKREAKAVMKLIFGGGWDVFVGFISILLPVCLCPVCFLEQKSSSGQKNKIFTWRNAEKDGLFKLLTGFGG